MKKKYQNDDNGRAVGYGCLWAVIASVLVFVASIIAPSFSDLPRHIQDRFHDTDAGIESFHRNTIHAMTQFVLLLIAGFAISWFIQRQTTKRLKKEIEPNKGMNGTR